MADQPLNKNLWVQKTRKRAQIRRKLIQLQQFVPNCSKSSAVSIVDDTIEYLRELEHQVQMVTFETLAQIRHRLQGVPFDPMMAMTGWPNQGGVYPMTMGLPNNIDVHPQLQFSVPAPPAPDEQSSSTEESSIEVEPSVKVPFAQR